MMRRRRRLLVGYKELFWYLGLLKNIHIAKAFWKMDGWVGIWFWFWFWFCLAPCI